MARVLILHSAQGLRPGVLWFARRLADLGHEVTSPDYFGGEVFEDLAAGVTERDRLGRPELMRRAASLTTATHPVVYLGFSLGCRFAQWAAQHQPAAVGCVLISGAHDPAEFDAPWPRRVPLTMHAKHDDEWFDLDTATVLLRGAPDVSLHLYPGADHLFADPDLPGFDAAATEVLLDRVDSFVRRVWMDRFQE